MVLWVSYSMLILVNCSFVLLLVSYSTVILVNCSFMLLLVSYFTFYLVNWSIMVMWEFSVWCWLCFFFCFPLYYIQFYQPHVLFKTLENYLWKSFYSRHQTKISKRPSLTEILYFLFENIYITYLWCLWNANLLFVRVVMYSL